MTLLCWKPIDTMCSMTSWSALEGAARLTVDDEPAPDEEAADGSGAGIGAADAALMVSDLLIVGADVYGVWFALSELPTKYFDGGGAARCAAAAACCICG